MIRKFLASFHDPRFYTLLIIVGIGEGVVSAVAGNPYTAWLSGGIFAIGLMALAGYVKA